MMSILLLAVMVVMVATMRGPAASSRSKRPAAKGGVRLDTSGTARGTQNKDATNRGVVSYRLLQDKKLPSATQRALRRVARPFSWFQRRFSTPKPDASKGEPRTARESVELQNFLDARNREIARRKSEGPSKPGPEDTLH
jgi:hypothetical protein